MQNILKKIILVAVIGLLAAGNIWANARLRQNQYAQTTVLYSQDSAIDQRLINLINASSGYVYFAIYTITRSGIADALIAAKLRGADVKGILDFSQSTIDQEKPIVAKLKKYNIPLEIPVKQQGLMHIKMLVTERGYASGSFNWTTAATFSNDEVLEIGAVPGIRAQYLSIFQKMYARYASALQH